MRPPQMKELRTSRDRFAFLILCLTVTLVANLAERVDAEAAAEVGWYMSPPFIESSQKIWSVREMNPPAKDFFLVFSTNNGTNWQTFGSQLPSGLAALPSSVFVHAGRIFIAEAPVPCRGARVLSVNLTTQAVSLVRYLDPTATILPWGWTLDGQNNLWAGQYGIPVAAAPPECQSNGPINVSYILQIADSQGNPVASASTNFVSHWSWHSCSSPENCFGSWLGPLGSTSDRHVHNLRYDAARNVFLINSGDSPRAFLLWNGDTSTRPTVVPSCCATGYVLTGFTGLATLSDAVYVGDDWTSVGRQNSIRKYPWIGTSLGAPVTVLTLHPFFDTPIFDLHASGETEIYFVNYDEPTPTQPNVRRSGLHRLKRASASVDFPGTADLLFYYESPFRNIRFIAADRYNSIPPASEMPYIFLYAVGTRNGAPLPVITRVPR